VLVERRDGREERRESLADAQLTPEGVAEAGFGVDRVVVPAALPGPRDVAGFDEFADDPVGGPLGDPDGGGDVSDPGIGVAGRVGQGVPVVCEQRPAPVAGTLGCARPIMFRRGMSVAT
jgi:hypothetical protein